MKKTILFVVDKPDWAYEFMVKSWLKYLLAEYDCYVIYQQDYLIKENNSSLLSKFIFNFYSSFIFLYKKIIGKDDFQFFSTHKFFYKKHINLPVYKMIRESGEKVSIKDSPLHFDFLIEMAFYFQYTACYPFKANKRIVGVFTDSFPHDGPGLDLIKGIDRTKMDRQTFYSTYLDPYDHIFVGGGNLFTDYKSITDKVSFVYGIYGEDQFIENKAVAEKDFITIGWTGTPKRPMKGFEKIIVPAIENVKKTGRDVRLKTKFSGEYEELYSFYKDVDFIVIASSADSGPSLFAEAALSGVPCISTEIGLPMMVIKNNDNGIFITRDIKSLEMAIIKLYDDRSLLKSFSSQIKEDYLAVLRNELTVKNVLKELK